MSIDRADKPWIAGSLSGRPAAAAAPRAAGRLVAARGRTPMSRLRMIAAAASFAAVLVAGSCPTVSAAAGGEHTPASTAKYPFADTSLPLEKRLDDLIGRMSLHNKVGNMFMSGKMAFGNDVVPKGGDYPSMAMPNLGVGEFIFMGQGNVYRGAANGCNIGCCSCYDPPTCTGGACCCTDAAATQFPQG
jgi:hypothetical protein